MPCKCIVTEITDGCILCETLFDLDLLLSSSQYWETRSMLIPWFKGKKGKKKKKKCLWILWILHASNLWWHSNPSYSTYQSASPIKFQDVQGEAAIQIEARRGSAPSVVHETCRATSRPNLVGDPSTGKFYFQKRPWRLPVRLCGMHMQRLSCESIRYTLHAQAGWSFIDMHFPFGWRL